MNSEKWVYSYPDGAHNAESLIVTAEAIVIVTKPDRGAKDHRIYSGPLGGGGLRLVHTFRPPAPADPRQSLITGVVATDADWDGTRVLLLTYDDVISYEAPAAGADPADFAAWPHRQVPIPALDQAEGIASLADHCGYAVVSEARPHRCGVDAGRGALRVTPAGRERGRAGAAITANAPTASGTADRCRRRRGPCTARSATLGSVSPVRALGSAGVPGIGCPLASR